MEDPKMLWSLPPNWNVGKEHIPADWDWRVQVSSPDMIGQVVGHYQITATFNEGTNANGPSYRAIDKRTGGAATLKLLCYWLCRDPDVWVAALNFFHREAKAVSTLNHPNIATVYESEVHEGQPYLVMEALEGQTLRQKLKSASVSAEEFVRLGTQLASAMATAHANEMLLHFLNPETTFVTSGGDAKVLDSGVEYLANAGWDWERPDIPCWHRYMAPEEHRGVELHLTRGELDRLIKAAEGLNGYETCDARTDLYRLGLVLYELAARRYPFSNYAKFREGSVMPLVDASHLHSWLTSLILKLLEKEPEDRYQSALEVLEALKQVQ